MDGSPTAHLLRVGDARVIDAGDAFADRIDGQLDRAYRLAAVILGSAMEAEDAVADAALAAWRSREHLREADRFDAWFGRIVVNTCRDRLRVRKRRPVGALPAAEIAAGAGARDASRAADFRDGVHARDELSRAFETLDPDDRIVLILRFWLDLSIDAIADRIGVPSGTVKSRLHHATARLRAALIAGEVHG